MRMVVFRRSGGGRVFVNPMNVVEVVEYDPPGDATYIVTNVATGDKLHRIAVEGAPQQVASELDQAMR